MQKRFVFDDRFFDLVHKNFDKLTFATSRIVAIAGPPLECCYRLHKNRKKNLDQPPGFQIFVKNAKTCTVQ